MDSGLDRTADIAEQAGCDGHGQLIEVIKNGHDQGCDQPDDDQAIGDIDFIDGQTLTLPSG